jgi:hypothetical protein
MFKAVRVILSLIPDGFLSGLARARGGLDGFLSGVRSGISTAGSFFTGLNQAVALVERGIHAVKQAMDWLNETFLEGAMSQERFEVAFRTIVGEGAAADEMLGSLSDRIIKYGLDADKANQAATQAALGLKGMFGEVDPTQLEQALDIMQRILSVRPDIVGGEQAVMRGIIAATSGDLSTLTRLLDIPLEKMQEITGQIDGVSQKVGSTTEQQLGQVTSLTAQAGSAAEGGLDQLEKLLESAGITQDVVDNMQQTTGSKIDQMEARWEEFTRKVGEELLPIVNEQLDKFIAFLDEHQEEIDAFAEALGRLAGEGFEKLVEKLEDVDWQQAGQDARDFGEDVRYIVEQIAEFLEKLDELSTWEGWEFLFGGGGFGTPQDFMANQGQQGQQGWNLQEALGLDPSLPLFQAIGQRGGQQNREAQQQTPSSQNDININVTLDLDRVNGAWSGVVDQKARQAANDELGGFVDAISTSTGPGH